MSWLLTNLAFPIIFPRFPFFPHPNKAASTTPPPPPPPPPHYQEGVKPPAQAHYVLLAGAVRLCRVAAILQLSRHKGNDE